MKRHENRLTIKNSNNMPSNRAMCTNSNVIDNRFTKLNSIYDENGLHKLPFHIFNADESGFQCVQGKFRVVCGRGRNPKRLSGSNEKSSYPVLVCCNAFGEFLPPHILYKGGRLMSQWCIGGPAKTTYDVSDSGWMETSQFFRWFSTSFVPHCSSLEGKKIMFFDGHASHITSDLVKLARDNNIILFKLPPHTTHVLQPLDVSVFKSVKAKWKEVLNNFFQANGFSNITKQNFPPLIKAVVEQSFKSENVRSGFETSGLFPLNREKITNDKLQIGAIFNETISFESSLTETEVFVLEPSTPSTPLTPLIISTPKTNLTPYAAKKNTETETVLRDVESILKFPTQNAAEALKSYIVKALSKPKPLTNRVENVRLPTTDYVLTEEHVIAKLNEKENAKATKAAEIKRKKKREKEKRKKNKLN